MVRSAFLSAVLIGIWLVSSAALAQLAKPKAPELIPAAEWLGKPLTFSFDKTLLPEAIKKLNVQCVLDVKAMEEEAINPETPISGKSEAGPALESLNAALQTVKLSAELRHDVIYIAPAERLRSAELVCRFYRLKPMVAMDGMIKKITTQTAINSWDKGGGRGHIATLGTGTMAISQSPGIHREIEKKFVKQLFRVSAPADRIAAMVPTNGMNPLAKLRVSLRRPISVYFPETPLSELVLALGKQGKVTMVLDERALVAASFNVRTPVAVQLEDIPLESVLALTLQKLGLSWTIDGEQVLITIPPVAEQRLIAIRYDVRDLTAGGDFDALVEALTRTVQPDSWADVGGTGKIGAAAGELLVTQSVPIHRAIETWLADLRTALKPAPGEK